MENCRVCGSPLGAAAYVSPAPALTSVLVTLDVDTTVYVCESCSHAQGPDLPELQKFYDTEYRISLDSDDHDQLFATTSQGQPIYRTDQQAKISLDLLKLREGARLLDFGAAKAATLKKMFGQRPDLKISVFDVSCDYQRSWEGWVPAEEQAMYSTPHSWHERFDAIMSHFVLEHVAEPVPFLQTIRGLLKPGGQALLSVPDVASNPGDMVVVDHLNHFTEASLQLAFTKAGLAITTIDRQSFPGAFFVTASAVELPAATPRDIDNHRLRNLEICQQWTAAQSVVRDASLGVSGQNCGIYGAGFYGHWIYSQIGKVVPVAAFMDQNPHLQGTKAHGISVIAPKDLPLGVTKVFVGLNPIRARQIIETVAVLNTRKIDYVWL